MGLNSLLTITACSFLFHLHHYFFNFLTTLFTMPNTKILLLSISVLIIGTLEVLNLVYYKEGLWIRLGYIDAEEGTDWWCESIDGDHSRFIIEPANSRSDYFYIVFGAWVICRSIDDFSRRRNSSHNQCEGNPQESGNDGILMLQDTDCHELHVDMEEPMDGEEKMIPTTNMILRYPLISLAHGVFNILHGLGSFFYHACECDEWFASRADGAGMLTVGSFGIFYTPLHIYSIIRDDIFDEIEMSDNEKKLVWILSMIPPVGQTLVWSLTMWRVVTKTSLALTTFLALNIASVFFTCCILYYFHIYQKQNTKRRKKHSVKIWLSVLALVCFFLGFGAWRLGVDGKWCFRRPKALTWFQAHAVWHFMTCIALLLIYLFYRTETISCKRK